MGLDSAVVQQNVDLNAASSGSIDSVSLNMNQHFAPEDLAAMLFLKHGPAFEQAVKGLTGNEARRVLMNLVCYPLWSKKLRFSSDNEEQVYYMANDHLMPAKYMMFFNTIGQAIDKAQETDNKGKEDGTN